MTGLPWKKSFPPNAKVSVTLDIDSVKNLQENHGGWNDKMKDVSC